MFKPLLLLPAVILFGLGPAPVPASMPQEGAQAPSKASSKAGNESLARAKKIYEFDCAICHGSNGNGKTDLAKDMQLTLDDWTDPKSLGSKTDQQLFDLIRKGKDKMPAEEDGRAKNDEIKALIVYIRNMSKDQPAAAPAAPAPAAPPAAAPSSN
jgi:mono/diheme cytochrome c family protein